MNEAIITEYNPTVIRPLIILGMQKNNHEPVEIYYATGLTQRDKVTQKIKEMKDKNLIVLIYGDITHE